MNLIEHKFYNNGGIKTSFNEIKDFIINKSNKNKLLENEEDSKNLIFDYIDFKESLLLPLLYKTLIKITPNDKVASFTQNLNEIYGKKSKDVNLLLNSINNIQDIPYELLSKYYLRKYTDQDSYFYGELNKENKRDNYLPYIKVLYEGIKSKSLALASNNILYRGSLLAKEEIKKIKNYLNRKIEGLPGAIVFSKTFLSFTKEKKIANSFLNFNKNNNSNLSKVLFEVEKDENINYSLSTHADIEKLSYFPNEKEVLFFPFSSFEIKEVKEIFANNETIYLIKLFYLGKYMENLKNDINIINSQKIIPNNDFKKEIIKFGLIQKENIENNNIKQLLKKYDKYEKNMKDKKILFNKEVNIINSNIKNFENNNKIYKLILNSDKNDKIMNIISKLYKKGLISDYIQIDGIDNSDIWFPYGIEKIMVKKFICSKKILPKNWDIISKNWIPAWHGTKFEYLESVVENGLKLPGTLLKDGTFTQNPIYIPLKNEVFGIKNWQNAIFASPNIYYALNYSELVDSEWKGIIEVKIKPNSSSKHKSKFIIKYFASHYTPIESTEIDDIYRISSEKDIVIISITFIRNCYIIDGGGKLKLIDFCK